MIFHVATEVAIRVSRQESYMVEQKSFVTRFSLSRQGLAV